MWMLCAATVVMVVALSGETHAQTSAYVAYLKGMDVELPKRP